MIHTLVRVYYASMDSCLSTFTSCPSFSANSLNPERSVQTISVWDGVRLPLRRESTRAINSPREGGGAGRASSRWRGLRSIAEHPVFFSGTLWAEPYNYKARFYHSQQCAASGQVLWKFAGLLDESSATLGPLFWPKSREEGNCQPPSIQISRGIRESLTPSPKIPPRGD